VPSTFTTNTGIEKPADGEQTGLWGQTTNLNFDIVDRALNGSGAITLAGTTHTLTTSAGVLSDGQFAVLVFAGSLSAPNTVTIAPDTAQKLYWVRNTTSQDVILSQGSGTNVTVPAGATKAVYADGAGAGAAVVDLTAVFVGNVTGNVTGNADTAAALQTARTIGGVSFDGTANIDLPGVNQAGDQDTSGNADTATALETARTIGGVSFDGTANIDLPGVNVAGDQDTTGNAATATLAADATKLATPRTLTIGDTGKTFDGSADVSWALNEIGFSVPELTQAQVEDPASTVFGTVSGQRLGQAITTSAVLAANAATNENAVGSYAFLHENSGTSITAGATRAASFLSYSNGAGSLGITPTPSGTWRCMGRSSGGAGGASATLWLRIS